MQLLISNFEMISGQLIEFLSGKGWWYESPSADYQLALKKVDINEDSDFYYFFSHAEEGVEFSSRHGRLFQIGWHLINTSYLEDSASLCKALNLPDTWLSLDGFEGEGGFFYDKQSGGVSYFAFSKKRMEFAGFSEFLEYFFEIPYNH